MRIAVAVALVFIGCCSNVVFLEELVREFPMSGNLITFSAFVFNALEGFFFTSKFLTKKPAIPIRCYVTMVLLFFMVQTINNYVLGLRISMPLQMIFRSGSLVANLVLGFFILKRRYKMSKYLSIFLITIGIIMCTMASASDVESHPDKTGDAGHDLFLWTTGIIMLISSLFLSAWMGVFQEQTYSKYGKHPSEALFYNHLLPLPCFLLLGKDIYSQALQYNASAPAVLPLLGISAPKAWIFLLYNTITQYICIRAVFVLTTECTSLAVTLVVTLRKFISLIISILYFNNSFTSLHWLGAICVFGGTLIFTDVISLLKTDTKKKE